MSKLLMGVIFWLAAGSSLAAPAWGQHGMALFGGKEGLYASHLPMFHAPHAYQVVLRLRLADAALDARLRARLDQEVALWTIDPEKFDLERLAPGAAPALRQFKANVVLGHFEQGGATEYPGVTVIVEQVLVWRPLAAAKRVATQAQYLQVGSGARRYLVKQIDSRPDYDHIVALTVPAGAPRALVSIAKHALAQPGAAVLEAAMPGARVRGTVYFDTRDLQ